VLLCKPSLDDNAEMYDLGTTGFAVSCGERVPPGSLDRQEMYDLGTTGFPGSSSSWLDNVKRFPSSGSCGRESYVETRGKNAGTCMSVAKWNGVAALKCLLLVTLHERRKNPGRPWISRIPDYDR
jgi:hypothetical protein